METALIFQVTHISLFLFSAGSLFLPILLLLLLLLIHLPPLHHFLVLPLHYLSLSLFYSFFPCCILHLSSSSSSSFSLALFLPFWLSFALSLSLILFPPTTLVRFPFWRMVPSPHALHHPLDLALVIRFKAHFSSFLCWGIFVILSPSPSQRRVEVWPRSWLSALGAIEGHSEERTQVRQGRTALPWLLFAFVLIHFCS